MLPVIAPPSPEGICLEFWKLKQPFVVDGDPSRAEEIERYNRQLAALLGGDNCHNIDRV